MGERGSNIHSQTSGYASATYNVMLRVLIVGAFIMLSKFYAYYVTNSSAILTDALESIVNVTAGAFALFSIFLAALPKDHNHPYGHGKIEYFAAGFEGGLISAAGISILIKTIYNFSEPYQVTAIDTGIWLIAGGGVSNAILGLYLLHTGKKYKSLILVADGKHLLTDTYTSIGLIGGLIIIKLTGWVWVDTAVALIMAIFINVTGFQLIRKAVAGLMDETDFKLMRKIAGILNENRKSDWIDVHNMRIQKLGTLIHIDCHLTMPYFNGLEETHKQVKALEALISEGIHQPVELFILAEPCEHKACQICSVANCAGRVSTMLKQVPFTVENLIEDMPHHQLDLQTKI